MFTVLDVSVSGYRTWKRGGTPDRKRLTDASSTALDEIVADPQIFIKSEMIRDVLRPEAFKASIGTLIEAGHVIAVGRTVSNVPSPASLPLEHSLTKSTGKLDYRACQSRRSPDKLFIVFTYPFAHCSSRTRKS